MGMQRDAERQAWKELKGGSEALFLGMRSSSRCLQWPSSEWFTTGRIFNAFCHIFEQFFFFSRVLPNPRSGCLHGRSAMQLGLTNHHYQIVFLRCLSEAC